MGVVHKVVRKAASFESQMAAANRRTPSPPAVPSPPPAATTPVSSTAPAVSKYPRFGKRGAPQAFPSKLYEILEGENPEIVGWTATGRGFEVRDHARLSSEVLGRFFKQDKFSSFQRQLNLYGFRKITKGSESGSYQHPHFRRGERTTLLTIRRSTKASPARVVVPVSPASAGAGTPPASVPLASSNSGGGGKGSKTELKVDSSKNVSAISEQARSATPSPPPAPVARGVLPWPRPPALLTGAAMQGEQQHASGAREVSPDAASMSNAGKMGPADRQQPWPSAGDGGNSWGARGHPAAPASGAASSTTDNNNDNNSNSNSNNNNNNSNSSSKNQEEIERAQSALDQQDAEMVSLLQRMAKEAQDSPSRRRAELAAQQWEGARFPNGSSSSSSSQQQLQQPRFQMPRSGGAGSGEAGQAQQTVFAERLYDILSHERAGAGAGQQQQQQQQQRGFFFGSDGRTPPSTSASSSASSSVSSSAGFPHQLQHHQQHHGSLLSPYGTSAATTAPISSSSSSSSSSAAATEPSSLSHLSQPPPRRNDSFESTGSAHRSSSSSSSGSGSVAGAGQSGDGRGDMMVLSEQDRQIILARSRSGPSAVAAAASVAAAAAAAAAAEQDRQVMLARSRSGPAGFNRRDDEHQYYHQQHQHQQEARRHVFDHSGPNRSSAAGRGFAYDGDAARFGTSPSAAGTVAGSTGVSYYPLPSLDRCVFNDTGSTAAGVAAAAADMEEIRRAAAPWHGAEASYPPSSIGSYVN